MSEFFFSERERKRQTLTTRDGSDSMLKDKTTYWLTTAENKLGITRFARITVWAAQPSIADNDQVTVLTRSFSVSLCSALVMVYTTLYETQRLVAGQHGDPQTQRRRNSLDWCQKPLWRGWWSPRLHHEPQAVQIDVPTSVVHAKWVSMSRLRPIFNIFGLHFYLSFKYFLLSHFSLLRTVNSAFPLKDFVQIFTVIERLHNVLISISLPFQFRPTRSGNDGFSVWVCASLPNAITTVNRFTICHLFAEA